ncbi:hypothetical protein SDRG_15239 [Saprolegnia diclina VS20]|uniref:Pirin N-terminal domain-containing protein n=1 Tax=Saprolegnia diclina (strain VS20) TaxID=1156394 RepID=T0PXD6_SAPDV|nr:hypothetical protein SDRG_15239 [Saprolegnia diclina VS20]EQC26906.1 hypothetical protein SDRG_15239 [Saprolegnia diclina VS20]|eukprot:XP_008619627.1 hypothetical protein SDRG_15239 [Saprolegnia diclina VS20]
MLDEFHVQLPGRFPDHPHRGFETITYLVPHSPGMMLHEDFSGHHGELAPAPSSRCVPPALQQACDWTPLLAQFAQVAQDDRAEIPGDSGQRAPASQAGNIEVIVIAGQAMGATANVFTNVPITYVHFIFSGAASHSHALPKDHNAFVYIISGEGSIGGSRVEPHSVGLLSADGNEDGVTLETTGEMQCVGLSGKPINEPINSSTVHLP